jgi:hypothetical protein
MSNEFIGGEFDGVEEQRPVAKRPATIAHAPKKANPSAATAIKSKVEGQRRSTLEEWQKKPMLDPDAELLCYDGWGRKVELHGPGWEEEHLNDTRRFKRGDILTYKSGLMASTLTQGQVYGGGETYIQAFNAPDDIKRYVEFINDNGTVTQYTTKPSILPKTIQVEVLGKPGAKTVTIGALVMYEVSVLEPSGLAGLKLLVGPGSLMDSEGRDGYGVKE